MLGCVREGPAAAATRRNPGGPQRTAGVVGTGSRRYNGAFDCNGAKGLRRHGLVRASRLERALQQPSLDQKGDSKVTTPEQFRLIEQIFERAAELSIDARGPFLDENCADPEVRREVEALLEEHDQIGAGEGASRLERLGRVHEEVVAGPARTGAPIAEAPKIIGPYEILEPLGEGGFGHVYRARQEEPVRRDVALKILKLGMDTKQVVARFEAERHALALMEHPGIARVLDGGATESGRPYFVMELVHGVPITTFCDENTLTLRDRIALFVNVCQAVHHAHQKGIIHRDLKPSNILVATVDGKPVPKVIDFGIAKATDCSLTDGTLFTEVGQFIGTPAYMSPEQAELASVADLDTRSDIYSLGVLLYELLTGTTPFADTLREGSLGEILRVLREEEPKRPSTRMTELGDVIEGVARARGVEPTRLGRFLRGDLDWIIMKSLEKDRSRRYESASGLAADLDRHLAHEPVLAGPPTAGYRMRKFVQRYRGAVTAAVLVAIAVVAGLIGTTTFALREAEQRDLADANAKDARDRERETGEVADFQASMLLGFDGEAMGREILEELRQQVRAGLERSWIVDEGTGETRRRTPEELEAALAELDIAIGPANPADIAREMMDVSVLAPSQKAIDERFADQPKVRARLLDTVASAYLNLGRLERAEELSRRALALWETIPGVDRALIGESQNNLAVVLAARGKHEEALTTYEAAYEIRREVLGEEHEQVAGSLNNIAVTLRRIGEYERAQECHEKSLAIRTRLFGEKSMEVARSLSNLAALHKTLRRLDLAEEMLRQSLEIRQELLSPRDPAIAKDMNELALVLHQKAEVEEAGSLYREALEIKRAAYGEEHPEVALALNNFAVFKKDTHDYDASEELYRQALALRRRLLGPEHPDVATTANNFAMLLQARGDFAGAEPMFREALDIRRKALGPSHVLIALSRAGLGRTLLGLGQLDEAEDMLLAAYDVASASKAAPDRFVVFVMQSIAAVYDALHKADPDGGHDGAAAEWREKIQQRAASPGPQ